MKKVITLVLTAMLAVALCMAVTGCNKQAKVKVLAFELTAEDYAFAIQKGNTELLNQVNGIVADMKKDGSLDKLINSYFDGTATFKYENPSSQQGCLVVATNAYFPPFEYMEGNKFVGVDIEIASIIAEKLGKTLYISNIEFDAVIPAVQTGLADIAMAGITVNPARQELVDFAESYYSSAQVLVVRSDDTLFANCTTAEEAEAVLKAQNSSFVVGTQKGTTGYMYSAGDADFGYDGFKNLTTTPYTTGALAITNLANGQINAVILDKQPALMIAESVNG